MREFRLSPFGALSSASIDSHLALYKGYAEHAKALRRQLLAGPSAGLAVPLFTPRETLARRLSFEANGEYLHELFFEQFESAGSGDDTRRTFAAAVAPRFGSFKGWQDDILELAKSRGPGWVVTCLDPRDDSIENYWIDLHELGLPAAHPVLYVVDLWEHAYWNDYGPRGRDRYMADLFQHSDWELVRERYLRASRHNI